MPRGSGQQCRSASAQRDLKRALQIHQVTAASAARDTKGPNTSSTIKAETAGRPAVSALSDLVPLTGDQGHGEWVVAGETSDVPAV